MIEGMSFAVKYLSVIRAIDVVKGQSADKTRNRNRRRKSMSSRFRMGPEIVWLVKGRGLSAVADRSQPKNRQPESRMTMIP